MACATNPKLKEGKGRKLNLYFVYKNLIFELIGRIFAKIEKNRFILTSTHKKALKFQGFLNLLQ
jgi:hypothetical protein